MFAVVFADDTLTEVVQDGFATRAAAWAFLLADFGRCMESYTFVGDEATAFDEAAGTARLVIGERVVFALYLEPASD